MLYICGKIYKYFTKNMAKFSPCVRNKRNDELYPVYIRIFHNKELQYINTGLLVNDKGLKTSYTKSGKKKLDITDKKVVRECLNIISSYSEKINLINANTLSCKQLIDILKNNNTELSFTDFANEFIKGMINQNRDNSASCYNLSVLSLKKYIGKENIFFKDLTSRLIENWIESMSNSARMKSMYPSCIRAIFNEAIRKYNDYDLDMIKIRTNPFMRVKIPKQRIAEKRSVDVAIIKSIFTKEIICDGVSRVEFAKDAAMLIFCLAGINAADLYDMKESALNRTTWKLCYNRKKTRDKSDTGAYMEITVPELIRPLFDKYECDNGSLFAFSKRFSNERWFVKSINLGLKLICEELEIKENITTYTFRHSWATIAQNNCGATTEMVAFALNHASVHRITEGYIRKDYSPIDKLNKKVIDFVLRDLFVNCKHVCTFAQI